jgi:hypothetical protein
VSLPLDTLEVFGAAGVIAVGATGLATVFRRAPAPDTWFAITMPRTLDDTAVRALLRHLAANRRPFPIVIEAQVRHHRVEYRIGIDARTADDVVRAIGSFVTGTLVEPVTRPDDRYTYALEVAMGAGGQSLRTDDPAEQSRSILTALTSRPYPVVMQWVLGPRLAPTAIADNATAIRPFWQWVARTVAGVDDTLDAHARHRLRDKVGEHGFRLSCRLATTCPHRPTAAATLRPIVGAQRAAEGPGTHVRVRTIRPAIVTEVRSPRSWRSALNVSELTGALAFPFGDHHYTGVRRLASRRLPASDLIPTGPRIICDGTDPTTTRPLAQDIHDALTHTWIGGPSGEGKTTLIAQLALADVAAGRGVIVIDPKADLVDAIAARIPAHRRDDVVILDASDPTPVGLNPLAHAGGTADLAVDQLLAIFRGLYPELGVRTADVLHMLLRAIAHTDTPTLCLLPLALTNRRYLNTLAARATDEFTLKPFFDWYTSLSAAELAAISAPVQNKVRPLLRESLRGIVGQLHPRFQISDVFSQHKILLVSLGAGVIGPQAADLLGSIVVNELWFAAQQRAAIPPEQRDPVTCFIDEWQTLVHVDLADMLARSRAMGLGLILANQHLAQLPAATARSAVLANARSKVVFRLSTDDAATMARTTALLDTDDFQSLGRYEVYASIVADGHTTPWASGTTRPLGPPTTDPAQIRARSRGRYGVPRAEIDAQLRALLDGHGIDGVLGKRKRGQP